MRPEEETRRFEELMMPHLDAAHNLALWLTRDPQDAQDVVQEAFVRALRFFDSFRGSDARCWLLSIVRNTGFTWLKRNRGGPLSIGIEDPDSVSDPNLSDSSSPDALLIEAANKDGINRAIAELPEEYREVLILRELEELSYKEIAQVAAVPIGTVMSRLARARDLLRKSLADPEQKEARRGL